MHAFNDPDLLFVDWKFCIGLYHLVQEILMPTAFREKSLGMKNRLRCAPVWRTGGPHVSGVGDPGSVPGGANLLSSRLAATRVRAA